MMLVCHRGLGRPHRARPKAERLVAEARAAEALQDWAAAEGLYRKAIELAAAWAEPW